MNDQPRLSVGVDLDGCFVWFHRAYVAGCRRMGMAMTGNLVESQLRWEFYEDLGHSLDTFVANCHRLADEGLLWDLPLIPGSKMAWNELADAGYDIHVKTDRSFGDSPAVSRSATLTWLRRHDLRYNTVTFTPDKTTGPRVDLMIEDKLANYDALTAAGVTAVLINRPWNQVPGDDRLRVDHLEQFVDLCYTADLAASAARR